MFRFKAPLPLLLFAVAMTVALSCLRPRSIFDPRHPNADDLFAVKIEFEIRSANANSYLLLRATSKEKQPVASLWDLDTNSDGTMDIGEWAETDSLRYSLTPQWVSNPSEYTVHLEAIAADGYRGYNTLTIENRTELFFPESHGLPSNNIRCIAIDSNYHKWIATASGGLADFDGTAWNRWDEKMGGETATIVTDSAGNVFFGTKPSESRSSAYGIYVFQNSEDVQDVPAKDRWATASVSSKVNILTLSRDGATLWFTNDLDNTADALIGEPINTSNATLRPSYESSIPGQEIFGSDESQFFNAGAMCMDAYDKLWVAFGLTFEATMSIEKVRSTVFISIYDGSSWLPDSLNRTKWIFGQPLTALCPVPDGNVWVATDGNGIFLLNNATDSLKHCTMNNSKLPSNAVSCLALDSKNSLWIGTQDRGLARCRNSGEWSVYDSTSTIIPLPGNNVRAIAIERNYIIWIGTNRGLVKYCILE
jgi:ligand-binding sensor domain-containing protein